MTRTDDSPVPDYPGRLRLDGRGFVVVGAGQGIGRQAAHALASVGARLVCVDIEPDLAHDIAKEVDGLPWVGDARHRDTIERLVDEAPAHLGRLDGVVDIVGRSQYTALVETDDESWDWHHDIVLRHAWLVTQCAGKLMARQGGGGALVFVASVSGMTGAPMHAAYGAAKAGLMALVRSAAVELGPSGIRVNAVAPGVVWTPRVSQLLSDRDRRRNEDNAPLRRVAVPADIASALLFLASDLSSYISGQVLVVDGGVGANFPYPMPESVSS